MENFFVQAHTSFIGQTGYNAHARDFFTALSKIAPLRVKNFTVGKTWNSLGYKKSSTGRYGDPHAKESYLTDYQRSLINIQTLYCNENEPGRYGSGICDYEVNDGLEPLKNYEQENIIDIILSETGHHYYYCLDKYKGIKIAYNVWESTRYDDVFFGLLRKFDQFWCPSEWQKQCVINQGYPADKVFVVPEAVDGNFFTPDYFNYDIDLYKDFRFKFILIGRWEYRKATKEIIETFLKTFKQEEPVDLILAVDNSDYAVDGMKTTEERLKHFGIEDSRLKILHFLQRDDYLKYLRNGNVFLSCSRSEGWNLPLIESMACGTPSIYSNCSGQLEFASGKGHPVKIIDEKPIPDSVGNYYEPDFADLSKVMKDVYINYWKYKEKALKDSEIIRKEFSWENAAQKALTILKNTKFELNPVNELIEIKKPEIQQVEKTIETKPTESYDNVEEQRFWNNKSEWERDGDEWSDVFGGTEKLWNEIIYPNIQEYLKNDVLEIAPGYGRITKYLIKHSKTLSLVDLNDNCIKKCIEKFGDKIANYVVNNGRNLNYFNDKQFDFIFSWDSFVHMDKSVIDDYLKEIYRVLKKDGVGAIHHSYFYGGRIQSKKNIAGRSNMTPEIFKELAEKNKLTVISQTAVIGGVTDFLTIFKKKYD
jgi:glycosyltransferase involved in cell wall biosynthesis